MTAYVICGHYLKSMYLFYFTYHMFSEVTTNYNWYGA